ncbi:MAG: hypothetical protein J6A16_07355 [Oscillospiraceae bacterium]|nr:hypothetical protein [Oscillospiraceae bacterium]
MISRSHFASGSMPLGFLNAENVPGYLVSPGQLAAALSPCPNSALSPCRSSLWDGITGTLTA